MSTELREAERIVAEYTVNVRPEGARFLGESASMTNLSAGGFCFVVDTELHLGQRIEIEVPENNPVITLKARVIWCRPQRDKFSVGSEFVEMSTARRARFAEMHRAIRAYQEMNSTAGAVAMNAHQAAVEWFSQHANKFLANV
jgi:hypothetical protein